MRRQTKVDKRLQLIEIMEAEKASSAVQSQQEIVLAPQILPRHVKSKRKRLERKIEKQNRPVSGISVWLKMTFGSSFIILAIFAIPIAIGLLVMLATVPEVISQFNVLPSTIITVTIGTVSLLFIQSALISTILVFVLRLRNLKIGTIITSCISLVPIMFLLNYLMPIFEIQAYF